MSSSTGSPADSDTRGLTAPAALVDNYLAEFLDGRALPENLREAIRYAVLAPGKRMRPLLVMYACEAVGGVREQALAPAAAIEMIHAFSLVHDDLPAMDNDELRRGRPTLHVKTSEGLAILAGDALMGLAFELLATRIEDAELSRSVIAELASGTNDMVAGQVYDTFPAFDRDITPLERLAAIHLHKTGALMKASVRMGAMVGEASDEQLAAMTSYGEAIGLMFQVVDDVLDVTQTTEHLGKTAGKDAEQDKLTYPAVIGLDASRREIERLQDAAHAALRPMGASARPLHELCDFLAVRTK
jgi:geranylgeranyl diphosphate synthase type II